MTDILALEYIPKRMCELNYGTDYSIRFRHFVLQPGEGRKVHAYNQLFVLVEPFCDVRIESIAGLFDMSDDQANELQYEHRGDITILNRSIFINHVRFIQVIPKLCKPCQ
ncbi:MAG: hypothetical protein NVS3B8_11840 [Chitinophagaceae bacterium]